MHVVYAQMVFLCSSIFLSLKHVNSHFVLLLLGMVGDGVNCTKTDPCESSPCYPGATCTPLHEIGAYKCGACPKGLIGDGNTCRLPHHPCESNPCYEGVACGEKDGTFECGDCPSGMIGDGMMCKGMQTFRSNA